MLLRKAKHYVEDNCGDDLAVLNHQQAIADLARQLGLTPAARLRAGVVHEHPPDPEEERASVAVIEEYKRRLGTP